VHVLALDPPPLDARVGEVVAEIVGHWLPASQRPGEPGLVPDPGEHRSGRARADLAAGAGDEEIRPAGEPCAGLLVARVEDPRDLGRDRQPAAAVSLRPDDVNVPVLQVCLTGLQGAGLTGPQPARVHQREERRRLPSPRRAGLQPRRRGEELLDLLAAQQVRARRIERGFPPVRQHAGVVMAGGLQPPAEVADVRHPRPVPARAFQPACHPAFDGALIKNGPAVLGAPGVELP
jgi:hypothetical protein